MREHTGARIAAPAKFDVATMERVQEIFNILDDEDKFRREMIIEFIMPIGRIDQMFKRHSLLRRSNEKSKVL